MATERKNLGRDSYQKLRHLLIHSQIQPGVRLAEVEWASRLGVHRVAIREALALLAHEGLLRRGERGGYFTPVPDKADLQEVWEARAVIEAGALRLIGLHGGGPDPRLLDRLSSICDLMQQNLDAGMELGFLEADRSFHEALVELGGNGRLIDLYKRAPLPLGTWNLSEPDARRHTGQRTIDEHRAIVALLRDRKINEAVDLLSHHLHADQPVSPIAVPERTGA